MNEDDDFYHSLYEFGLDAVLYTAPDGRVLAANSAACALFQHSEAEICALGRQGLVDFSESPELGRMLEERERTGKTKGEITLIRGDGTRFVASVSSAIFRDHQGERRTVMVIRDLTETIEREAEYLESIYDLDDLYNNAPCGYHSVDKNGTIIRVNQTELKWMGCDKDEVVGKQFYNFLSQDSQKVYKEEFIKFMEIGVQNDLELELIRTNGHPFYVLLNSTAVYNDKSEFVMSRTILTDLTAHKELEQVIEHKALELQSIMDGANIAITLVKDRIQVWANQRMGELFGYTLDDMRDQPTKMFFLTPEDYEEFGARAYSFLERGLTYRSEIRMRHRSGEKLWIDISGKAISPSNISSGVIWVLQNITARKLAEQELERYTNEFEDLYDNAPCGYHSVDPNGIIVKINQTELNWLGYERSELLGKHVRRLHSSDSKNSLDEKFEHFSRHEPVHDMELELVRKDGTIFPVLLNATAVYDDGGEFVMSRSTIVDITDRKDFERELKRRASIDFLTGLNNRANASKLGENEFLTCRRLGVSLGVLMFDVDHFKKVNDTYGHEIGDEVLKAVGVCCIETMRSIDIVGRWGGEEFVVFLPGADHAQLLEAAERLRIALSNVAVNIGRGRTIGFTVSVGASWVRDADTSIKGVISRADTALYSAKGAGRNCVRLDTPLP